jgi:type III restriction enzyme
VLIEKDGEKKLYFVLETKANIGIEALRPTESAKIACGRRHFAALDQTVAFKAVDDFEEFVESI